MENLEEAITVSKKGKRELRSLVARGKFAIIEYLDPETRKRTEDKVKLVLARDDGKVEEYFLIPTATPSRFIAIVPKEKKGQEIKAFNPRTGKIEEIIL